MGSTHPKKREPPPRNSLPAQSSFQTCCISVPTSPPRPLQFRTEWKAQQQDMGLPVYLWSAQWNLTSRSLETQPGYASCLLMKQGPPSLPCSSRAFPEMKKGVQRKHGNFTGCVWYWPICSAFPHQNQTENIRAEPALQEMNSSTTFCLDRSCYKQSNKSAVPCQRVVRNQEVTMYITENSSYARVSIGQAYSTAITIILSFCF